ncbi:MAG: hypothetical protein A2Z83_02055 [Omnitrophica bacterium GWA2_52_8]|nr:MAG: hypothetical protein A2Z83_02055 [Omnitrophica bacterium GWA2_52_8]
MGIAWWKSAGFFALMLFTGMQLLPSERQKGLYYAQSMDFDQAQFYLARQFYQDPSDAANAVRYLASLNYRGQYDAFDRLLPRILKRHGDNEGIQQLLGDVYEGRLDLERASRHWRKLVELAPSLEDPRDKLLRYSFLVKNMGNLIWSLYRTIEQPTVTEYDYEELGLRLMTHGKIEEAKQVFQKYAKRFPYEGTALLRLGQIAKHEGDMPAMLEYYSKMIEVNPENQDYARLYLEAYFESGDRAGRVGVLEKLTKRFAGNLQVMMEMIDYYERVGQPAKVVSWLETAYTQHPGNPVLTKILGGLYLDLEDYDQALWLFRDYRKSSPLDYQGAMREGETLLKLGRVEESRVCYEDAWKTLEAVESRTAGEDRDAVRLMGSLGLRDQALALLKEVTEAAPGDPAVLELAGSVYRDAGDFASARRYYELLLKRYPGHAGHLLALGELETELKDYEKAKSHLLAYHEKTGGDRRSYHLLGDVLAASGDDAASRRAYERALELLRKEQAG